MAPGDLYARILDDRCPQLVHDAPCSFPNNTDEPGIFSGFSNTVNAIYNPAKLDIDFGDTGPVEMFGLPSRSVPGQAIVQAKIRCSKLFNDAQWVGFENRMKLIVKYFILMGEGKLIKLVFKFKIIIDFIHFRIYSDDRHYRNNNGSQCNTKKKYFRCV